MVSSNALYMSLLALLPLSMASPVPDPLPVPAAEFQAVASSTEAIDWVPFDWEGKTIYVNSASIIDTSLNPAKVVARALLPKRQSPDCCGASTFNPHPGPYPTTGDCGVIRDWSYGQNTYWSVQGMTSDTHGLWYYESCVFEAGTANWLATWIGSTDVGDVTRDAINIFQYGGLIASQGNMGCSNFNGLSSVNWKIKHS